LRDYRQMLVLMAFLMTGLTTAMGDEKLSANLIIIEHGDPLYTYWGHIGIAMENHQSNENLFYDFGNFTFYSEHFYWNFLMGRMIYLGYVIPTENLLSTTQGENRNVTMYRLNLGNEELEELDRILRWWVLPENREYLYDYYHYNCSTVIRDILDTLVQGELRRRSETQPDKTYRHYTRTGSFPSFFSELLLHYLLGPKLDEPISWWDKMFLPQSIADFGSKLIYTGADGVTRQLVGEKTVLMTSDRPPVPDEPRALWLPMLIMGIAAGSIWMLSGRISLSPHCHKVLQTAALVSRIIITVLIGFSGLVLGFLMTFTDHTAAYANINIGPAFPTVLLGLFLLMTPKRRPGNRRREKMLSWLWTINLVGLIAAMLLRATGLSIQDAYAFWAFFAPLNLAASRFGLWIGDRWLAHLLPAGNSEVPT